MWAVLCVISLAVRCASSQVVFPPDFIGTWTGTPEVSVLGPWTSLFTFHIATDPTSGGWFMHDVMNSTDGMTGVQRFYVDGSGYLTYCGALDNFFSTAYNGTVQMLAAPQTSSWTSKSVTWCVVDGGCDVLQWTLQLMDANTLVSGVILSSPVNHLQVTYTRTNTSSSSAMTPAPHACSYGPADDDTHTIQPHPHMPGSFCPYKTRKQHKVDASQSSFCFVLNTYVNYRVMWTYDNSTQLLSMAVTASVPANSWIAFGFQPQFPFMLGADVVLGYALPSGQACVRTMYVPEQVGVPIDDSTLSISNSSVSYADGYLMMSFTRPMNSGHNPLPPYDPLTPFSEPFIMWAVGQAPNTCTDEPMYHGNNRGMQSASFVNPTATFPNAEMC